MRSNPARCIGVAAVVAVAVAWLAFPLPARGEEGGDAPPTVATLIARMPAQSAEEEDRLVAALFELGRPAVKTLGSLLTYDGKDAEARYALSAMVTHANAREDAGRRDGLVEALVEELERRVGPGSERDPEGGDVPAEAATIAVFLIEQLERTGDPRLITPLGKLLDEERLVEPATRALLVIGGARAEAALVAALESSTPTTRVPLVRALGELGSDAVTERLLELARSDDRDVRVAALYSLAQTGSEAAEATLAEAAAAASPAEQPTALAYYLRYAERLAEEGDAERAARICRELLGEGNAPNVRCAALSTLTAVLGVDALDYLLTAAQSGDPMLSTRALELSERLAGPQVTARWVEELDQTSAVVRARIVAALGRRGDATALPPIRKAIDEDPSPAVRYAAILAAARLEKKPALPVLVEAIDAAAGSERAYLIGLLPRFGGATALAAVVRDTGSDDAEVARAATDALLGWPESNALDEVLAFARRTPSDARREEALESYLRIIRRAGLSPAAVFAKYQEALEVARTARETSIVLGGYAGLRTVASLERVSAFFGDAELAPRAMEAALDIASPRRRGGGGGGLRGQRVRAVLQQVVELARNQETRGRAETYLENLPKPDPFNLAQGRPVRSDVNQQGENPPEQAVDGSRSRSGAWFGERWPCWLEVDLEDAVAVEAVELYFWRGDRYYQYTVELSSDGDSWRTVVDASENTTPCGREGFVHRFEPAEARYLRLNVLKNSANASVHLLELRAYAQGKLPPDFGER